VVDTAHPTATFSLLSVSTQTFLIFSLEELGLCPYSLRIANCLPRLHLAGDIGAAQKFHYRSVELVGLLDVRRVTALLTLRSRYYSTDRHALEVQGLHQLGYARECKASDEGLSLGEMQLAGGIERQ